MMDSSTGNYNCYPHDDDDHNHHVNSSRNPNATTSFETSPSGIFNFEAHNSVSHNADFYNFDESSLQRCVFPCEPNERPSQGLSLSLSSANPSSIGLQQFELVRPQEHHYQNHPGYFGKSMSMDHGHHHQQDMLNQVSDDDGGYNHHQDAQFNIRSSRYLFPAQELLNEFCNLGSKQSDHFSKAKAAATTSNQWQDHDNLNNASASKSKSLSSVEFMELQKRKTKLLQMLEEVDRRYKHYCDQMKAVVSSFEAVAGNGAAKLYSSLASKAMSRHFRCLRDGIVNQIKSAKVALGEKDVSAPGSSRGETPRLRVLDQTLRQQRAFQQMTMMDSHPWRPQRGLPERSVSVLRAWLFEHFLHPYPNDVDKHILARQTGLSRSQVSNWFINARRKYSECLSSIINHSEKMDHISHSKTLDHSDFHHNYPRITNSFGAVELDFSAYNNHNFGGGDGSGGVSLTLGLQQHGGSSAGDGGVGDGVSLAFSSASQSALFYPRDNIDDCQPAVQYSSLLEGDQGRNLPYRNLMGAQLLHDLAG
nr:homeobox protein BEL1 homolog [Tanacetum cinerariifolium]